MDKLQSFKQLLQIYVILLNVYVVDLLHCLLHGCVNVIGIQYLLIVVKCRLVYKFRKT